MKKFLSRFYNTIIEGRMRKAEYEIANMLWKTEYQNESFAHILSMVRSGKISEIGIKDAVR